MAWDHAGRYGPESFTFPSGGEAGGAAATVRDLDDELAVLYLDRDRSDTTANPTLLDELGNLTLYLEPGVYVLEVDGGYGPVTFEIAAWPDPEDLSSTGGSGVELGETSTTAHRGDHGHAAWLHSEIVAGNPHGTTAVDVGADPVGAADAERDRALAVEALKADLVGGVIPTSQLPALAISDTFPAANQAAMLALDAQRGDLAIRTDNSHRYILTADTPTVLSAWVDLGASTDTVLSVNGQVGIVVLGAVDVGADPAGSAATAQTNALAAAATDATTKASAAQAAAVQRANHTGTQAGTTVTINATGLVVVTGGSSTAQSAIAQLDANAITVAERAKVTALDTATEQAERRWRTKYLDIRDYEAFNATAGQAAFVTTTPTWFALAVSGDYIEWTEPFAVGTWRFAPFVVTTNANSSSVITLTATNVGATFTPSSPASLGTSSTFDSVSAWRRDRPFGTDLVVTAEGRITMRAAFSVGASRLCGVHCWRVA